MNIRHKANPQVLRKHRIIGDSTDKNYLAVDILKQPGIHNEMQKNKIFNFK